ncbi:hypothetical protein [Nostoc sp. UHCC 0870]|uniref:hypothetical protein n=1 Tax=Nostoc sp. UHCC 0870 TaxID=2914041 RepID=UPI001EDD1996|nr:hypothetical protein [Nostoc sp. UHCC 0870]UKP01594.1 hypothetical protein L6494_30800 [Nostoc sp. UHCC 0870]
MTAYMARQKKPTLARSVRFLEEIAEILDNYADDQMISSNAAVNKLVKERLEQLGYKVKSKSNTENQA